MFVVLFQVVVVEREDASFEPLLLHYIHHDAFLTSPPLIFFLYLETQDIYDAKAAVDHLSGFNVGGRYLIVLYYQPAKFEKRAALEEKEKELVELRKRVSKHKAQLGK